MSEQTKLTTIEHQAFKYILVFFFFLVLGLVFSNISYAQDCCVDPPPEPDHCWTDCGCSGCGGCSGSQCNSQVMCVEYTCDEDACGAWDRNQYQQSQTACQDPCPCPAGPPDPPTPTEYMNICGHVINGRTGDPMPAVEIEVRDGSGNSVIVTTDNTGLFRSDGDFEVIPATINTYAVRMPLDQVPTGFWGRLTTYEPNSILDNGFELRQTFRQFDNRETTINDNSYETQMYNSGIDCASEIPTTNEDCRCNFALIPYEPPSNGNVVHQCDTSVYPPPLSSTFTYDIDPTYAAPSHVIRANRFDGETIEWVSTNDFWVKVPDGVDGGWAGSCTGTNCTLTLPFGAQPYLPGQYLGWSVEAYDDTTPLTTIFPGDGMALSYGAYDVPYPGAYSCTPWTITGVLEEVDDACNPVAALDTTADAGSVTVTFDCSGGGCSLSNQVGTSSPGSGFIIGGVPFIAGDIGVDAGEVSHNTIPEIEYELLCSDIGGGYVQNVGPGTLSVPINMDSDKVVKFGYYPSNIYESGWLHSLNGDVYGAVISNEVPYDEDDPPAYPVGVESYLSAVDPGFDTVVFSDFIDTGLDLIAEPRDVDGSGLDAEPKYLREFTGHFWPKGFAYIPSEEADENEVTASDIENGRLEIDSQYKITINEFNTFLSNNTDYSIGGTGEGVALVYVYIPEGDPVTDIVFSASGSDTTNDRYALRSDDPDKRILIVTQTGIDISKDLGYSADAVPQPLIDQRAHLEAGIISRRDILFEAFDDGAVGRVIIVEGPFVAGNNDDAINSNIIMERNLGDRNILSPSVIVNYNPIYLTRTPQGEPLAISDITWEIDE